jgi:DNA replication initiation complex subunit (GINS family)
MMWLHQKEIRIISNKHYTRIKDINQTQEENFQQVYHKIIKQSIAVEIMVHKVINLNNKL